MATSASLALGVTGCIQEQVVNCSLTVTNSATGAITITSIQPYATTNGGSSTGVVSVAFGAINLGPNSPFVAINPSGSTGSVVVPFSAVFHGVSTGASGGLFAVGATVYCSDGSSPSVTAQTIAVSGINLPDSN